MNCAKKKSHFNNITIQFRRGEIRSGENNVITENPMKFYNREKQPASRSTTCKKSGELSFSAFSRVEDRVRTGDLRNHNPTL